MSESRLLKKIKEVIKFETVSIAKIQRTFAIGYAKASGIVDEIENSGLLIEMGKSMRKYDLEQKEKIIEIFAKNLSFLKEE